MPPERTRPACFSATPGCAGAPRAPLGAAGGVLVALVAAGCAVGPGQRAPSPAPVVNAATTGSIVLSEYLQLLQRLVQGRPSEQAEIVAKAQREYDTAPTPSRELKLALILGTPGHPATNLTKAQTLLRELMREYSPLEAIASTMAVLGAEPPDVVMPSLARAVGSVLGERPGLARTLFYEVTGGTSDATEAIDWAIQRAVWWKCFSFLPGTSPICVIVLPVGPRTGWK